MITEKQKQQLAAAFNKQQLEGGIYGYVKKFYTRHFFDIEKVLPGNKTAKGVVDKFKEKKQFNKAMLDHVCFSVFETQEIYTLFLKTLPTYIQRLIEILLWQDAISHEDAEKELKMDLLEENRSSFYSANLKRDFYFFLVSEHSQWTTKGYIKEYTLYLPKPLRQVLAEYYPKPKYYYFEPVEALPAGHTFFNAENQIFLEMPAIIAYHLQEAIKYTNSGRPNDASVNKMQRSCNLAEFYNNEPFKNIRTQMMAGMLHHLKIKDINTDSTALVKTLFTEHYKSVYTPQFILTHLKGWQYVSDYYVEHGSFEEMLDAIKQLPQNKWVSQENLEGFIKARSVEINGVAKAVMHNSVSINDAYAGNNAEQAGSFSVYSLISKPYINGVVFLMAAFGLVEIAHSTIDTSRFGETFFSAYDGLRFLRLTPLGAHVLGLTDSYTPRHADTQNKLYFGEDALTIAAEGDLAVIDIMLAKFTEKEGPGRYRATTAAFFKDCKNLAAVETKISQFKKTVSVKLPKYWDATFAEWKANAKIIQPKDGLYVFQVPATAKGLHSLFARDGVLKSIIFKAEGFYVLVENTNIAKFKQRLKELGYFIE